MQDKPLRADALRNRRKILENARDLITRFGADVPTDAIAEAAGVAAGTLYRHFPDKAALIDAVLQGAVEELGQFTEDAGARVESGRAQAMAEFRALAARYVEHASRDRAVRAAADRLSEEYRFTGDRLRRVTDAGRNLLARAQADGDMHPDITIEDVFLLVHTAPTDAAPAVRDRWLALMLAGFTAGNRPGHAADTPEDGISAPRRP
ncbi:TetR/AcrR family transcriptional regulator [Kitasatospora phosalacinea]|uniref:TetR/AcrR family transcriptional regulator n=1 Tax=Kitasatospora phosalacinea TaxID=2065 RepID=UPI00365A51F3